MKFIGKTNEFIELTVLDGPQCDIFTDVPSSSLTILWFESDENDFIIDGKPYTFNKNQIVFFTEFHKIQVLKKGRTKYLRFNRSFYCIIDHDVEVSCKGILFFGASQLPVINISNDDIDHFETLWKMFSIEMEWVDNLQAGMLQMMLKRYLILCTRLFKSQHQFTEIIGSTDIVREFNFLVETYFKTKHSVVEYAELLNKSPKTISNVFSKLDHKSPLQYIQDRKMLEARRLLVHSGMSVKEIANEIGFEDLQSFSRFFKKYEGISPSEYRKG
jgi:AraC-like DNA-binding protein